MVVHALSFAQMPIPLSGGLGLCEFEEKHEGYG